MTPAFVRQLFIYEYVLQTYKKRLSHPNQDILEEKDHKYANIIRLFEFFASLFSGYSGFFPSLRLRRVYPAYAISTGATQ